MTGRLFFGSSRRLATLPLVICLALPLCTAPALAQSTANTSEAPVAPAAPAGAPPEPGAAPPTVPAPPNQAPPIIEPTPAATPSAPPGATLPQDGAAPTAPGSPTGNAAFPPLPAEPSAAAQPQAPVSAAAAEDASLPQPVSHADYQGSSKRKHSDGLLGPFRIGFLLGTGLPEVANLGAQLKLTRFIGAGVNVGLIPTVKISYYGDAAIRYQEYDAYGRIYPFGGAFFLGTGVGYANIKGTLARRYSLTSVQAAYPGVPGIPGSVDVDSDATVRTLVLTPQIGFMKIFDIGFAIGLDIGAQIPIAPSKVDFHTVAPGVPSIVADAVRRQYIDPNDEKVRSTLDKIGRTPLPTINFKIGWFL